MRSKHLLVGIVHVVVDRIKAGLARAGIPANRAAAAGAGLGRGIRNVIAVTGAAALESMIEAHPMADLVSAGLSKVVSGKSATWDGLRVERNAISVEGGAAGRYRRRQIRIAQGLVRESDLEVNIEILVGSLTEGTLHGQLVVVSSPAGIDGAISAEQVE